MTKCDYINEMVRHNKMLMPRLPLEDDFLSTMRGLLYASRCFGISTTGGVFVLAWFTLVLALHLAMEAGTLWKVYKVIVGIATYSDGKRSVAARLSGAIFYGNAVVSLILFWRLRSGWQAVVREWKMAENFNGIFFPRDVGLKRKLILVIVTVAGCGAVEHIMSMMSTTAGLSYSSRDYFEEYILNSHAFLIIPSDYSIPLGIAIFFVSKISTVLWNFQDMFIILISIGLTSRYKRLNKFVESYVAAGENVKNSAQIRILTWKKVREAYVRQSALVKKVDRELGPLILLSNANNFYFICLQIFNGVGGTNVYLINTLYYYMSIVWLCARACGVMLAAADVNEESRAALKYLLICGEANYNVEVQRLQSQLTRDFVALSGMGFFNLERNLLLDVAAAIFKYELVLLEFDQD